MAQQPTVIEQTSKKWKAQQLIGAAIAIAGVILLVSGAEVGFVGMPIVLLGMAWFIVARVLAWWNHG